MPNWRLKFGVVLLSLFCSGAALGADAATERLTVDLPRLLDFNVDWLRPHEARLQDVPDNYDWAKRPRIHAGNNPESYSAVTGWGQIFSAYNLAAHPSLVDIRNFQVLLCQGKEHEWVMLQ